MIDIVTILGSAHRESATEKALALFQQEIREMEGVEIISIVPANLRLNFPGLEIEPSDRAKLQEMVGNSDGIILATPEYHGSFSSLLKLVTFVRETKCPPTSLEDMARKGID